MTNEDIAEQLVRNHKDFEAEGFSEYMNGYLNGIILGLEYAQGKVNKIKVLPQVDIIKSVCECGSIKFNTTVKDKPFCFLCGKDASKK